MAGRLIILFRWVILATLVLSIALIIARRRFPAPRASSRPAFDWFRDMLEVWHDHREDQRERAGNMQALRGKLALLVDPDPKSLRVMTWKLERAGCRVIKARNGFQALNQARDNSVDVIFADTLLPDVSAPDFYQSLPAPKPPVVFVGVLPSQYDDLRALGRSVVTLAKPYDPDEATSQAGRLLRRQPA